MITFVLALIALIIGYFVYGKFVERVFSPDDRPTPAIAKADGVDFIVMPNWKVFMIQFLNIAGTGPIFGAIMGAKFGPVAYLWIVLGCIFAGATHDYLSGMLSVRHGGSSLPELVGSYLGTATKRVMLCFAVLMLMMVGVVFVYSPAEILGKLWEPDFFVSTFGPYRFWILLIFLYYILATMLPVDKIIGKFYPLFAFALLFMAGALMVMLFIKYPDIPELWDHFENMGVKNLDGFTDNIFPALFITIACGAISGFHATQSPLMARCINHERHGRPIFYGAMITEGIVAVIWATVAMYFFYDQPMPGYELMGVADGSHTSAPSVVNMICKDWLGIAGGILAMLGVVAAPITSGDTAFRSSRLIIAEAFHLDQKSIAKRFLIAVPMFAVAIALLVWQMEDKDGFNRIWSWFGWGNQTLSVFTLWTLTVYLVQQKKAFVITLVPALFMTTVCSTFLFVSKQAFGLAGEVGYSLGGVVLVVALIWFLAWYRKAMSKS